MEEDLGVFDQIAELTRFLFCRLVEQPPKMLLRFPCHSSYGPSETIQNNLFNAQLGSHLASHFSFLCLNANDSSYGSRLLRSKHSTNTCGQRKGDPFYWLSTSSRVCSVSRDSKSLLKLLRCSRICRSTPGAQMWHRSKKTRAFARDSGVSSLVLEPACDQAEPSRLGLETRLTGLSVKEIGDNGFSGQLLLPTSFNSSFVEVEDVTSNLQECLIKGEHGELLEGEHNDKESKTWHLSLGEKDSEGAYQVPDYRHAVRLEETMLYLESIGVDFSRMIRKDPTIVKCRVERARRVVHFLEHLGFRKKELGRILNMCPRLLNSAAWKDLKQSVIFLVEEVGLPRRHLKKVINSCPRLLVCSVKERMMPTLRYLRCLGFTEMGRVILIHASILTFGIDEKLVPKLRFLEGLGLSHEEAVCMALKFPAIFNYSLEGNLKRKYLYLVNEMGGDLQDLKAFPHFFGYSLDNRIRPRHQLLAKRNIRLSMPTMLKMSDEEFQTRFGDANVNNCCRLPCQSCSDGYVVCLPTHNQFQTRNAQKCKDEALSLECSTI